MHTTNPNIGLSEEQLIIGTILGGSSVVKTPSGSCYLCMRDKNSIWLEYKANRLKVLTTNKPFTIQKETNRWHSQCYPVFGELREIFYKDRERCITVDRLDKACLHNLAFAVWYLDCGVYKEGSVSMNTTIWGEKGTKEIIKYFHLLNWESNLIYLRKSIRVQLNEESTKCFLKIVDPEIPDWAIRKGAYAAQKS